MSSNRRIKPEERDLQVGMTHRLVELVHREQQKPDAECFQPFQGILKLLYSDFVVREIPNFVRNADSQAALHLTEEGFKVKPEAMDRDPAVAAAGPSADATEDEVKEAFTALIGEEKTAELWTFASAVFEKPTEKYSGVELGHFIEKEKRTGVHKSVKKVLGDRFVSNTDESRPGVIILDKATRSNTTRRDRQEKNRHRNKFLHFTLYKENTDSNSALRLIANKLGLSTRQLTFSGTKDKRAITLQRVACKDLSAEKVARLNKVSFGWNSTIKLADFEYRDDGLQLGDAKGNHFTITLRDPFVNNSGAKLPSQEALNALRDVLRVNGCVNYYGPQRFGTTSVLTSDVGGLILRGDYAGAVYSIVKSEVEITPLLEQSYRLLVGTVAAATQAPAAAAAEDSNENGKRSREETEPLPAPVKGASGGDVAAALEAAPHFCYNVRDMLKHLVRCPGDFLGALMTLPRTLMMLYCHSVQSLVWNVMASRRVAAKCSGVLPGDLVLVNADALDNDDAKGASRGNAHLPATRTLTQEDVDGGKYTLADVLLPVPGTDTDLQYPAEGNACSKATFITEINEKGFTALVDKGHALGKQLHFHGTYRKLVLIPKDIELSRIVVEGGIRSPAVQTDREIVLGDNDPVIVARNEKINARKERRDVKKDDDEAAPAGEEGKEDVVKADEEGEKEEAQPPVEETKTPMAPPPPCVAVVAKFSLGAGSYATSVLRELCTVVHDPIEDEGEL